jgi:GNAT superfamily N-acetyltransferase
MTGDRRVVSPPDFRQVVVLLDGSQAVIRPICPVDKDAMRVSFYRMSPDTRFLRFHYAKSDVAVDELEHTCNVDYNERFALVAEKVRSGQIDIVGVGRYDRLPDPDKAEVSFVVEDKEQKKGIGTYLLNLLAAIALERGITTFIAELLNENAVMLDMFRKYAPQLKVTSDGNSVLVKFPLVSSLIKNDCCQR